MGGRGEGGRGLREEDEVPKGKRRKLKEKKRWKSLKVKGSKWNAQRERRGGYGNERKGEESVEESSQ